MRLRPVTAMKHPEEKVIMSVVGGASSTVNSSFSQLVTRFGVKPEYARLVLGLQSIAQKSNPYHDKQGLFTSKENAVLATVFPKEYLRRVGADEESVLREQKDKDTIAYFRYKIRTGQRIEPPEISLDSEGNVIGANGRHRALAYQLEEVARMPVVVRRAT